MEAQKQKYSTDMTDRQWEILKPLMPKPKKGGRPRKVDIREVINAIFYITKTGCQWRLLPNDFPKWKTVYDYFRTWKLDGTWKSIHDQLRDKTRKKAERKKNPTAGIIDSQSVKTTKKSKRKKKNN